MKLPAGGQYVLASRFPHGNRNPGIEKYAFEPRHLGFVWSFKGNRVGGIEGYEVHFAVSTPQKSREGVGVFVAIVHVFQQDVFVSHASPPR